MDDFKAQVWDYYRHGARSMPWRDNPSFYYVLVSEMMLQQTQVQRVIPKFNDFIERFPTLESLALAPLSAVIEQWVGLGYNRRAKYLHEASKRVAAVGQPTTLVGMVALPGVGKNTAAAIMNYVYNAPTPFIETNIRTVYINHFFNTESSVSDTQIMVYVMDTLDVDRPREWFWALMDYGTYLKSQGRGSLSVAKQYKKQGALKGSVRQMRGWIVKVLSMGDIPAAELNAKFIGDNRYVTALEGLKRDGLIDQTGTTVHLTK